PGAVDRVLQQPRLAGGERRGDRASAAARRAARVPATHPQRTGGAMTRRIPMFRLTALVFGFAFLYIPILSLIVYSFNRSRLVTVWGGFSTEWYARLMENEQILQAAWLSLRIAAVNATGAVILG